jgi:hypothetical protein
LRADTDWKKRLSTVEGEQKEKEGEGEGGVRTSRSRAARAMYVAEAI